MLSTLYALTALLLAVYTCGHGWLLIQYVRHRKRSLPLPAAEVLPAVTVQLPIYNERYVALRLLDAVLALDYPRDKLHIQVLDDSTDVTSALLARRIADFPQRHIEHIQRAARTGYKAGALAVGLQRCDSPFVAIFDADFVPPPDFLRKTVPYLVADARLGVVQTRWGHLNADANPLTRAQVLSIDTHFLVEQTGRNRAGWPLPFNGTGGVWRRETIVDAGGWSADTLTEDLDLSFRAQLKGWRSLFLPHIVVPGELPSQLAAYRQQQARWATGSSQNLRRLLLPLWRSDLSLGAKLMGTQHLAQYIPHVLMLLMLLLAPPLLLTDALHALKLAPLGIIGLIPPLMYAVSQYDVGGHWLRRLAAFPFLLLLGTGLVYSNARAVLRGLFGSGGEFRRTPKFSDETRRNPYWLRGGVYWVDGLLMLYALWGAVLAGQEEPGLVPYLLLHAASFAAVIVWDHGSRRLRQRAGRRFSLTEDAPTARSN